MNVARAPLGDRVQNGPFFYCCDVDLTGIWMTMHLREDHRLGARSSLNDAMELAEELGRSGNVVDKIVRLENGMPQFFAPYDFNQKFEGEYLDLGSW